LSQTAIAQKDSLALNDNGKYIYYKVVTMDKYNTDTLYQRSLRFFETMSKSNSFKITARDVNSTSISGAGFFTISKPSMAKHDDGQIAYAVKLEIKGSKYRYWLTDFVYTPYFKDRYNNYVPDKGIEAPLEKPSKYITETELHKYLDQSGLFSRQLGEKLKKAIATEARLLKVKLDTTRRVHIDKW